MLMELHPFEHVQEWSPVCHAEALFRSTMCNEHKMRCKGTLICGRSKALKHISQNILGQKGFTSILITWLKDCIKN